MIDYETFCQLRQLHDVKGLKASQIAAALDLDPKTVEKWIDRPTHQHRKQPKRPSAGHGGTSRHVTVVGWSFRSSVAPRRTRDGFAHPSLERPGYRRSSLHDDRRCLRPRVAKRPPRSPGGRGGNGITPVYLTNDLGR